MYYGRSEHLKLFYETSKLLQYLSEGLCLSWRKLLQITISTDFLLNIFQQMFQIRWQLSSYFFLPILYYTSIVCIFFQCSRRFFFFCWPF